MNEKKIMSLLGLAFRAGKVVSGEFAVKEAIRGNTAKLVIVAGDASDNTRKLFHDKSSFYHVPIVDVGDKQMLGKALGKQERAGAAVLDEGFAAKILEMTDKKQEVR